jgi:hypothetical protein
MVGKSVFYSIVDIISDVSSMGSALHFLRS